MANFAVLISAVIIAFVLCTVGMLSILPQPHRPTDYLVAGAVSSLACLLIVFLLLIGTSLKGPNIFFKRRKR